VVCHPKHVEQLRNIGIINSTTHLHLVNSFYEIYINVGYAVADHHSMSSCVGANLNFEWEHTKKFLELNFSPCPNGHQVVEII